MGKDLFHLGFSARQKALEIIPHEGAEQSYLLEVTLPAEGGDLLAVDLDGQFLQRLHGMRTGFGESKDFATGNGAGLNEAS